MNNIISIFQDTLKKEMRNRALGIIFILNIVLIIIVNSFVDFFISMIGESGGLVNIGEEKGPIFMFFVNKWTGVLSILFGVNCIKSDDEEGILGQIISLPISRTQYLIGRILGSTTIVAIFYTILSLFAGFIVMLGFLGFAPLIFLVVLYALETLIAALQAYIFTILTCIYLNDALHPDH